MIRHAAGLCVLLVIASVTLADDKKPKDQIVGKWESQDSLSKGVVVEFKSDGTTTATYNGKTMSTGKYKFVEDDLMEFEATFLNSNKPFVSRFRIKIAGDDLTQVDEKTKIEKKLKRLK